MIRQAIVAAILLAAASRLAEAGSVYLEAETFDGLPYVGNWIESKQWYVKRHYHASGGAFVVAHCAGPKMTKKLAEPVPAGACDVVLRTVLNRSHRTKNVLRVSLGNVGDKGKFAAEDGEQFVQDFEGSGYGWYRLPRRLDLKKECSAIEIEAVQIENMGIGDDPEYPKPYAILDALVVTDEKIEITKGTRGRNDLAFVTGKDPRKDAAKLPYPKIQAHARLDALAPRPAFLPSKNLLRNSSFELCLKPHFSAQGSSTNGYNVDADCLCTDKPFHGRYCIEFVPKVEDVLKDYTGAPGPVRHGGALSLYALGRFLGKEIDELAAKGPLVLSLYLRTNGRKVSCALGKNAFEADHADWKRYSAPLPKEWAKGNVFGFTTADPEARVWLDAMQLERGEQPTDYVPLDGLEAGFQARAKSNIFYRKDTIPLELSAALAKDGKPEELKVKYALYNTFLEKELEGAATVAAKPGEASAVEVPLAFAKLGSYLLVYEVAGHPEQGYAVPIYVVEDPKSVPRNRMLGAIVSTNEEIMAIFRRAGFDWVNTLNDRTVYFSNLWPARDDMRFYDKYWKMWGEKHDIQYSMWIVPFVDEPKWDPGTIGVEAAAHMGGKNMSYANWEQLWERLTKRVSYIDVFQPVDELSYHRGPHDALPYVDIATRVIRKNRPGAKIMCSSQATHILDMLRIKPDLDVGDALGGSRHNMGRNSYFYDRHVKEKTGKPYWIVGVGWGGNSWYGPLNFETLAPDPKAWPAGLCRTLGNVRRTLFEEAAIIGIERFGAYVAKFDRGADPCSFFEADNTLQPFAVQFVNTVNFLRTHKAGNVIHADRACGVAASYVLRDGRACAMIVPDESCEAAVVKLDVPADKVKAYDFNLNPIPFQKEFPLPIGKCLIVEDAGMGADALIAAIRGMEAHPAGQERRLILPGADGLELATFRQDGGEMKKASAEPMPAEAGLAYPLDMAQGGAAANWATVAARADKGAIRLDGKADEPAWRKIAPSFIYCWAAMDGSYGAHQGIEGFEKVFSLSDISSTHRALWDGENVFFSLDVLDDAVEPGDKIVVKMDADLLGDLAAAEPNEDDYEMVIEPVAGGGKLTPSVRNGKGEETGRCEAAMAPAAGGYGIEVKVPLSLLKVAAGTPCSLGLNVELHDQDGAEKTVLSWTGNFAPRKSPRGYGQLVLAK